MVFVGGDVCFLLVLDFDFGFAVFDEKMLGRMMLKKVRHLHVLVHRLELLFEEE